MSDEAEQCPLKADLLRVRVGLAKCVDSSLARSLQSVWSLVSLWSLLPTRILTLMSLLSELV